MLAFRPITAGLVGAAVTVGLDLVTLPLVAVGGGALVAVLLARQLGAQARFDVAGATFALALGGAVPNVDAFPTILEPTTVLALAIFGALSGTFVVLRLALGVVVRLVSGMVTDQATATRLWEFLSAVGSTLVLVWTLIRLKERVIRTGVLGISTPLALILNVAGRIADLPGYLDPGIDLLAVVFVGSIVIWFHTLASWYAFLALKDDPLVRRTGGKTKSAALSAGETTKTAAQSAGHSAAAAVGGTDGDDAGPEDDARGSEIMARILGVYAEDGERT